MVLCIESHYTEEDNFSEGQFLKSIILVFGEVGFNNKRVYNSTWLFIMCIMQAIAKCHLLNHESMSHNHALVLQTLLLIFLLPKISARVPPINVNEFKS